MSRAARLLEEIRRNPLHPLTFYTVGPSFLFNLARAVSDDPYISLSNVTLNDINDAPQMIRRHERMLEVLDLGVYSERIVITEYDQDQRDRGWSHLGLDLYFRSQTELSRFLDDFVVAALTHGRPNSEYLIMAYECEGTAEDYHVVGYSTRLVNTGTQDVTDRAGATPQTERRRHFRFIERPR